MSILTTKVLPLTPKEATALAERAPVQARHAYRRALLGELPPRQAIRAKCLECVCWERRVDGLDRIRDCTVRSCPLWPLRPYQTDATMPPPSRYPSEGEGFGDEDAADEKRAADRLDVPPAA